ncbi:MAG: septum formation family protein [Actinomycetota bacterium]
MIRPALVGLLLAVGAACSDEEPPTWLEDLAADAATTTSTSAPPPPSTTTIPGDPTAAVDLEAGTCLVDPPFVDGQPVEIEALRTVACDEPHDAEIYAADELPQTPDEPFPGPTIDPDVRARCLTEFEAFVGIPWTRSVLEFASLHPSESSWAEGDRSIVCVLFPADGAVLSGSAEGSGV